MNHKFSTFRNVTEGMFKHSPLTQLYKHLKDGYRFTWIANLFSMTEKEVRGHFYSEDYKQYLKTH